MDKKMSEMKEQFLNEKLNEAKDGKAEAIERENQAIKRENEATQTAKKATEKVEEILGKCEDLESMVRAAKDEAMQVKKASDEHCSRCSKCDPCPYLLKNTKH